MKTVTGRRQALATILTLLCFLLAAPRTSQAAEPEGQRLHIAGLEVVAWLPEAGTPGPWPVVIFSHGFHGCATQSEFLTAGLAAAGYAVFAPEHRDAACGQLLAWLQQPEAPFGQPASWTADDYRDRAQDIEALIDALARDPRFSGPRFDYGNIGLVGHSLGGYTVLGLAGAWPQWKDKRVKAVLALSPYAAPYVALGTLHGLALPVMYQGGTLDFGMTPTVSREGGAYAQTPAPKYFVDFDRASHLAWTDLSPVRHDSILAYGRAFLDRYLKGVPFPPSLAVRQDGVAALWIDK